MTDLVERLRADDPVYGDIYQTLRREAADEIERLQKDKAAWQEVVASRQDEVERLRYEFNQLERQWAAGAHELEAADYEIERLTAKLDKIAKHPNTPELIRQYAAGMLETKP